MGRIFSLRQAIHCGGVPQVFAPASNRVCATLLRGQTGGNKISALQKARPSLSRAPNAMRFEASQVSMPSRRRTNIGAWPSGLHAALHTRFPQYSEIPGAPWRLFNTGEVYIDSALSGAPTRRNGGPSCLGGALRGEGHSGTHAQPGDQRPKSSTWIYQLWLPMY